MRAVETISLYLSRQMMTHTMTKYDKREQLPYMTRLLPVPLSFLSLPSLLLFSCLISPRLPVADRETEGTAMLATRESPCDDSLSMTEPIRTGFATS